MNFTLMGNVVERTVLTHCLRLNSSGERICVEQLLVDLGVSLQFTTVSNTLYPEKEKRT
jgi:hypothetical protein